MTAQDDVGTPLEFNFRGLQDIGERAVYTQSSAMSVTTIKPSGHDVLVHVAIITPCAHAQQGVISVT